MDAGLAVLEQVAFGLGVFALLDGYLIGVDLLDLLVVEHQTGLQHEVLLLQGNVGLHPEVRHVVELHLLLVIPQQEGLGEEGGCLSVDEGFFDDLRIPDVPVLLTALVLSGMREGVRVDALNGGLGTSLLR